MKEFTAHYHFERHHQGLGNRLILPNSAHMGNTGEVRRRERRWDAQLLLSRRRLDFSGSSVRYLKDQPI